MRRVDEERTTRALRETLLSEWARTAVSGLPPVLFVLGIYGRDDPYDDKAVKRARSAPGLDANSRFGGAQCAFFGAVLLWEEPQRFAQTRAPLRGGCPWRKPGVPLPHAAQRNMVNSL